ncbi:MAG: aminomethyl-transferring glycine dehydrogenase [Bacteroidales bacterium]
MATDKFIYRHNGPREAEIPRMLSKIGVSSLDELINQTLPASIRLKKSLKLSPALTERKYFRRILEIAAKNKVFDTYIGLGYYDTITPSVILRNILENPSWYTSYTPYQAEISQGRLEALLNFQTMVCDLTGMELANASLLDEGTAAAEAMIMMFNTRSRNAVKENRNVIFIDENIFPQTLAVIQTRAVPLGIEVKPGKFSELEPDGKFFGAIVQYPACDGKIFDYKPFVEKMHQHEIMVGVAADLMSLALITPPGEWGADIVFGTTQRFGVPMGYGGPAAAYFAAKEEYKRNLPGRIIGVSKDVHGNLALRMALQTREQHIKRERATSNICTAQALLAIMASMYAVYHGAEGIKRIALNIHTTAGVISDEILKLGYAQTNKDFFDTLNIILPDHIKVSDIKRMAVDGKMNFRYISNKEIGISVDETTNIFDINNILNVFARAMNKERAEITEIHEKIYFSKPFERTSGYLNLEIFKKYRSETEMSRYIKKLEKKDISLTHSMIPLGSCTMKLNSATSMLPLSWIEFGGIHPFVPVEQAAGYHELFKELVDDLCEITGFADISLQPNSGASGEYAGLMVIMEYHKHHGQGHRNVVLIPSSAHGTNPASAAMAGMQIVVVNCDSNGNIDVTDLKKKAEEHKDHLAAFMVTYPSTHGVFEEAIIDMCNIIHQFGGQVYMDGANMNAQVGLTNPALIGADVCHLNLHKTFSIPHGGGGPGVGPIGVAKHLVPFLPKNPVVETGGEKGIAAISSAPWGSASVLTISHAYIKMLGADGLTHVTKVAILNANYLAAILKDYYQILYSGTHGRVAHEMILDCRGFKQSSGITEVDIAKRLMDYGFHAPTLSFPVHGTLMVEPTESESLQELDRFIETMINIYREIKEIETNEADKEDNVLKNAPHTAKEVTSDNWKHAYGRQKAAYPLKWIEDNKYWPTVGRIDDAFGDRNLMCTCAPIDEYREGLFNK